MFDFSSYSAEQVQALILASVLWVWIFLWAVARAIQTAEFLDEDPRLLKSKPWRVVSGLALVGFLYGAYQCPLPFDLTAVDYATLGGDLVGGQIKAAPVAIGLCIALLWGLPSMVVNARLKKSAPPGSWLSPTLTLFRWIWLAIIILIGVGYLQSTPLLNGVIDDPLSVDDGALIAIGGALFYLVWWGIPDAVATRRANSGSPFAATAVERIHWAGLPALLIAMVFAGEGRPKKKGSGPDRICCPHCKRPVDDPEAFDSLRFDQCPHCEAELKPFISLKDYLVHHAKRILEVLNSPDGPSKGRASSKLNKREMEVTQRFLRAMFTYAVRERGTDLHLIAESDRMHVRCRTDGVLFTILDLPEALLRTVISSIKANSGMDITERRKPQDGSFKTTVEGTKLDVRVNTSPTPTGETASLRLLYHQRVLGTLQNLGLSPRNYRLLSDAVARPHGLMLVTGPTGSGKSTTLYNMLATMADGQRNIITLEDPIEFIIEGVTQMSIAPRKGFTFASGLSTILRQDPDVIMVGEIRDSETAKMAIDASMTGHLVLSTLHTLDTLSSLGRLMDLETDLVRHAQALAMVIAQRLVRLVCTKCAEPYQMTARDFAAKGLAGVPENISLMRGKGCKHCNKTGYYEREGIYEFFQPDEKIREMIAHEISIGEIRRYVRARGMRTLLEDGLSKAFVGRTTIDEILRVTN